MDNPSYEASTTPRSNTPLGDSRNYGQGNETDPSDDRCMIGGINLLAVVDRRDRPDKFDLNKELQKELKNKEKTPEDQFKEILEKSPALAALFAEKDKCPWGGQIKMQVATKGEEVAGYDPRTSTIVIRVLSEDEVRAKLGKGASDEDVAAAMAKHSEKILERTAHVLHTALHQSLHKLYSGEKPVSKDDFVSINLDNKAAAYLAEIKVAKELGHKDPVMFGKDNLSALVVTKDGKPGEIDEEKTLAKIKAYLAPKLTKHYENVYDKGYVPHYATNKRILEKGKLLKEGW